jgi:hypothetical protein
MLSAAGLASAHIRPSAPCLPACSATDIQLEFTMLDPHVRQHLSHLGNGTYSLRFKVPDVYGVFKYVINYKHLGYSYIQVGAQGGAGGHMPWLWLHCMQQG